MKASYFILHLMLIFLVRSQDLEDDRENWVDPTDMLHYDSFTKSMRKEEQESIPKSVRNKEEELDRQLNEVDEHESKLKQECNLLKGQLETCQNQIKELQFCESKPVDRVLNDLPYMKRFVHQLIRHFRNENYRYKFTIELNPGDYESLQKFATSRSSNLQDIEEILSRMIVNSVPLNADDSEESLFYVLLNSKITQLWILLTAFIFIWIILSRMSVFSIVTTSILLIFGFSTFWHWQYMYKTELAKRHTELFKHKDIPKECKPHEMTWTEGVSFWFKTNLVGAEDECFKYHKALLVDPFWDVSPAMAFAEAITRFFVQPLESLGTNIGKFYRSLHQNLPFGTSIFVIPFTFISVFFFFILCCGYRIRVPFLMSIEPAAQTASLRNNSFQQISEEVKSVRKMVEDLSEKPVSPKMIKQKSQSVISECEVEEPKKHSSSEEVFKCKCQSSNQQYVQELFLPEAGEPYSIPVIQNVKSEYTKSAIQNSSEKATEDAKL